MAHQVIWSPQAREDLRQIHAYIARDSEQYANAVVERVLTLVDHIPDHPYAGSIVPDFDDFALRERFVHSDRVIHRIHDDRIEIVTIIHGARQLPKSL